MLALIPMPEKSPISISLPEPKYALRSIVTFFPHRLKILLQRMYGAQNEAFDVEVGRF